MARYDKVGTHKTSIQTRDGVTYVRYWHTDVVAFSDKEIILDSGGWQTATTKTRMNQTANQFDLGFYVSQRKGEWFVTICQGDVVKELPFTDRMKIKRG